MLIFVYGSLKKGFHNHFRFIESNHAIYLRKYLTEPKYTMLHLGEFPGVYQGGDTAISGELYNIPVDFLSILDELEGCPYFYKRILIDTDEGQAWMWVLNKINCYSNYSKIESGEWL